MIIAYIDETGDTGFNLSDQEQPVFVLGALLIDQNNWKSLESGYLEILTRAFHGCIPDGFELHAMDLVNARKHFSILGKDKSIALRDEILAWVADNDFKVLYRKIIKKDYNKHLEKVFGNGIKIDPYVMAFPFIGIAIDQYLNEKNEIGLLVFDQHRINVDIQQSLRALRFSDNSSLRLERIIERGFFVDSAKSFAIQLVDLLLYYIRKYEEKQIGKKVSLVHEAAFEMVMKVAECVDRQERGLEIVDWVSRRSK